METFTNLKRPTIKSLVLAITLILALMTMFFPLTALGAEPTDNQNTEMVFILNNNTYTVNGELNVMDVSPSIVESRTMLPIRYAAVPLGAEVGWDDATKKVTVTLGSTTMELWIGKSNAVINGTSVLIDSDNPNVKPLIMNGRTMLPLRFVTEKLGCAVNWDEASKKISINKTASSSSGGSTVKPFLPLKPGGITQTPLIKPSLSNDIKFIGSMDLSKIKNIWASNQTGKVMKVTMDEADIPVVMRIGRGYNVFDKYASVDSLKQAVLDTTKLIQDQKMERIRLDQGDSRQIITESIRSYSNSISTSLGASGSYLGFGGSVNSNFDSSRTQELNNYFSTFSYVVKKYDVYVNGTTNLKNYLLADARQMINDSNVPASTVFANYGHYVLVDSITGGRVDYSITASSKSSTSYENFKVAAKADFNAVIFSAGGSGSYQSVTNKSAYDSNKDETLHSYGGDFTLNINQFLTDPNILSKWESTLEDTGTLVDFGSTSARALVPIWELCDNPARSASLKSEFEKLNLGQGNQWPMQKYVTDIVFVSDKNEWNARNKCPAGYQLINADLNAGASGNFIYLCYKLGDNINEAYTDMFMEYTSSAAAADAGLVSHNTNNVDYARIPQDLNQGSGGNYIYLWTSRAQTLPPITDMSVAFDDPNDIDPAWSSVYWFNTQTAADANKSAKGNYVYIKFKR